MNDCTDSRVEKVRAVACYLDQSGKLASFSFLIS